MKDWGEEIFPEGGGVKFKKWTRGEGEGKEKFCPTRHPISPLHQSSSSGQASKMAATKTRYINVPLQNNACTAG